MLFYTISISRNVKSPKFFARAFGAREEFSHAFMGGRVQKQSICDPVGLMRCLFFAAIQHSEWTSMFFCTISITHMSKPPIFVSRAFGARKALSHLFTWGALKNKAFLSLAFYAIFGFWHCSALRMNSDVSCTISISQDVKSPKFFRSRLRCSRDSCHHLPGDVFKKHSIREPVHLTLCFLGVA